MSNEAPTDALRMVPVEPYPEMLAAFWRQKNTGSQEPGQTGEDRSDYAAYRAMLAAAPASPLPVGGWQDISTAPKDGESILAICATAYSPEAGVTWWNEGWTHYSRPSEKWHGGVGRWFPTHWMPLPAAPTGDA